MIAISVIALVCFAAFAVYALRKRILWAIAQFVAREMNNRRALCADGTPHKRGRIVSERKLDKPAKNLRAQWQRTFQCAKCRKNYTVMEGGGYKDGYRH